MHVDMALGYIDFNGVRPKRESDRWVLIKESSTYPPKYVISLACSFAIRQELDPDVFGAREANNYLTNLGYIVREKHAGEMWTTR